MKKKILAISCAIVLSLSLTSALFARAFVMSQDLDAAGRTKCATNTQPSSFDVLKCAAGGGCFWDQGTAVSYNGKCK